MSSLKLSPELELFEVIPFEHKLILNAYFVVCTHFIRVASCHTQFAFHVSFFCIYMSVDKSGKFPIKHLFENVCRSVYMQIYTYELEETKQNSKENYAQKNSKTNHTKRNLHIGKFISN